MSLQTEQGFTMLEMLYAFFVFCIIMSLMPLILKTIFTSGIDNRLQRLEWEVFISQVKKEMRMIDNLYILNGQLFLKEGEEVISYEKYKDKIRRQVNMKGHEVMLQKVKSMKFEQIVNGVKLTVTDLNDHVYEVMLRSYIDLENEQ